MGDKMDFVDRKEKFYNRFGIEDTVIEEAAIKEFQIGIKNYLADIDLRIESNDVIRFCSLFGFDVKWSYNNTSNQRFGTNIFDCITLEKDWVKYLHKLQELFYLKIHSNKHQHGHNTVLVSSVKELIDNSKLSINIVQTQGEYIIFPAGSSFLDTELIVTPLKFLDENSHKHFLCTRQNFHTRHPVRFEPDSIDLKASKQFLNRPNFDDELTRISII